VSFDIRQGEVVGLVGESGSGKSTIGRSLVGLSPVTDGSERLGDVELRTATKREWKALRRQIAMVFQDPGSSIDPRSTIGESISAPLLWTGIERNRRALDARARELLDMVRLPSEWVSRHPHELSGGQRQRVGIARALAANPSLLVADEPTSALDVSVQATVLDLFRELQSELGFSCLFITHDLSVVEQLADHVVVLESGAVVEQGSVAAVLRSPKQDYTRALIAAAPVPDPAEQREKRRLRRALRV
jgi:peptide/nickel transport system ATP-binding protein